MIKNRNTIKDIKFHKVSLKNVKRIERSSQDIPNLNNYLLNKDNKNSLKSTAKDNILKTIEDKYSVINNNKNLINRPRRIKSTKKNMVFKVKDLILNQKYKKNEEEEKNIEENEINNNLKVTSRNEKEKKDVVFGIKRCKTLCNTNYNKNKIINNNQGKKQLTKNNDIIKNKKTKKGKKHKNNNNKNIKNEQSEGFVNKKKFKFLCCLW